MNANKIITIIGVLFISAGACVLLSSAYLRRVNSHIVFTPSEKSQVQVAEKVLKPATQSGKAVLIDIPALSIHNDVIDGYFDISSQQWTLTKDKVQFAAMTNPPNDETGLTFMYGHNRREVFSKLPAIQPGAVATVTTNNGLRFNYKFVNAKTYNPNDVSVFDYSGDPILVLQTCTGLFYENRQLFTFNLVGVERV